MKDAFFIVEPNQMQLIDIAQRIDAGHVRAFVKAIIPLNEASATYGPGSGPAPVRMRRFASCWKQLIRKEDTYWKGF